MVARLRRHGDVQRLPRQRQGPRLLALPQRQYRQAGQRRAFHHPVAVGPQQLQRRVQVTPGLHQVAQSQPAGALVRQADGFVDPVAGLAPDLQALPVQFERADQVALHPSGDAQRIEQPRLDRTQPQPAGLVQALQRQRPAGIGAALHHLRCCQQPQRMQPQAVVAGPRGAGQAVARRALQRRPVGHAHRAEAAAQGHFGAPAVVGQRVGQLIQRVQVGGLFVAAGLQVQRLLARTQQPPAQLGLGG